MKYVIYNTVTNQNDVEFESELSHVFDTECQFACNGNPPMKFRCSEANVHCPHRTLFEIPEGLEFFKVENEVVIEDLEAKAKHEEKLAKEALAAQEALVTEAYNKKNEEIYCEMERLLGTRNAETLQANYETWKLMVTKPELYLECGFKDISEVIAYASDKLLAAEAYTVYRFKRIGQFKTERSRIRNGNHS